MPRNSLRICVYTYKGGAAKTTIVVNAAAALAHPKHGGKLKTLLIDLDPQCNSTQFYHDDNESGGGGRTIQKEETEATADNGAANALLHALPVHGVEPKLISDSLHPDCEAASMDALVSSGQSSLYQFMKLLFVEQDASKIRALIEEQGFELLHKVNVDEYTKISEFGDNFWVLEGDPHIAEFEPMIANAFRDFTQKSMIKHIGLISYLMEMFTQILGFDAIIIDCSPHNSALNKAAALACDYILPPCNASLYSAGSVQGLLSSVLPGDDGWLGLHKKITEKWRDASGAPKAEVESLKEWLLPQTAPYLLPIMVSNYAMGLEDDVKFEPILPGASRSKRKISVKPKSMPGASDRVVTLMASQFVYTIMNYVNQECPYVAGHAQGPPPGFNGPLVRFRENAGKRVINFAENVPISMPVSEQVGRGYVELQLLDFLHYMYGEQKACDILEKAEAAGAAVSTPAGKKKKADAQVGMIDYGDAGRAFEAEVKLMKERYVALAAWLVHLLKEKRGVAAPAAAPAAARGSTSRLDRARRKEPEKDIKKGKGKAKAGPSRSC